MSITEAIVADYVAGRLDGDDASVVEAAARRNVVPALHHEAHHASGPGIVVVYDRASGKLTSSAAKLGLNDQDAKNLLNAVHKAASTHTQAATPADILEANIRNLVTAVTNWKKTGEMPAPPAIEVPAEVTPVSVPVSGAREQKATNNQSNLIAPEGFLIDDCIDEIPEIFNCSHFE